MPGLWRRVLARERARLRTGGRAAVLWALRLTMAAVASYVVGTLFFPGTQPLLAPLTAMLVVQVTPVSLLTTGLDRVVSVVSGVGLAVVFSSFVPLEWWSLGLLIFLCISIGQALYLRKFVVEVAISGMLVLGVGSLAAEGAAWQRLTETLVGALVGIAANLLLPPKIASVDAGRAIDGLADSVSELLNRAADELTHLVPDGADMSPAARVWLDDARQITYDIPQVGAALVHAEQGRRLNVRAVASPDVGPALRQGLEALEHSAVAIRSMFRAVVDGTTGATWAEDEEAEEILLGLARTFRELAGSVDAFGQLVRDEADPATSMTSADIQGLREALDGMIEARSRLDDRLVAGGPPELLELHAAVLSTVKRLLHEMDLDERVRRQLRLRPPGRPRVRRPGPPAPGSQPPASKQPDPDAETQQLRRRRERRGWPRR